MEQRSEKKKKGGVSEKTDQQRKECKQRNQLTEQNKAGAVEARSVRRSRCRWEEGEMRDYREIVWDRERLQEVTPRSYCLQKTIMAHTEVCMCDGVMCENICVNVCVMTVPLALQGTVGVRLYRWERLRNHDANSQGKENMVLRISCKSERQQKGTFTFSASDQEVHLDSQNSKHPSIIPWKEANRARPTHCLLWVSQIWQK